jgi:hypothetical protein
MPQATIDKKWKRGEINPETGLQFWQYELKGTKEVWKTPEAYADKCERVRLKRKEYNDAHVQENSRKRGEWRKANPERDKATDRRAHEKRKADPERWDKHKEKARIYANSWRSNNLEKARATSRAFEARHKERRNLKNKIWNLKNKKKLKQNQIQFRKNNPNWHNDYTRERRKTDTLFDLTLRIRDRTRKAFLNQGFKKHSKTADMIGCSWEFLQEHIEQQFVDGMNWVNRSAWHIDHIVPLASAETEERLIELCHYTNLQPLWAQDNLSKGSKVLS